MAFADHRFSPVPIGVERPKTVHRALHEPVDHHSLDEGSVRHGCAGCQACQESERCRQAKTLQG